MKVIRHTFAHAFLHGPGWRGEEGESWPLGATDCLMERVHSAGGQRGSLLEQRALRKVAGRVVRDGSGDGGNSVASGTDCHRGVGRGVWLLKPGQRRGLCSCLGEPRPPRSERRDQGLTSWAAESVPRARLVRPCWPLPAQGR